MSKEEMIEALKSSEVDKEGINSSGSKRVDEVLSE